MSKNCQKLSPATPSAQLCQASACPSLLLIGGRHRRQNYRESSKPAAADWPPGFAWNQAVGKIPSPLPAAPFLQASFPRRPSPHRYFIGHGERGAPEWFLFAMSGQGSGRLWPVLPSSGEFRPFAPRRQPSLAIMAPLRSLGLDLTPTTHPRRPF